MKDLLREALTSLLALLARLIAPALQSELSWLASSLSADLPLINAAWCVRFRDVRASGILYSRGIDATLYQFGRRVWGVGHVQAEPGDPFEYRGIIRRNVFYGTFRRKDARILAGTGTFILKIRADSQLMEGRCTWFDSDIDDVRSSAYVWTRNGSSTAER